VSDGPARLREDLLAGRRVVVAGGSAPAALAGHGAEVSGLEADLADETATHEAGAAAAPADVLLGRAVELFAAAGGGTAGIRAALDHGWNAVRGLALASWIEHDRDGAVLLLAPRPDAGPGAEATRAGLENMARTLSIEWARFGVRTCAVAPGEETTPEETGDLLAYLASAAGAYVSGTVLATA
jgi:hypothetical protein